jgi:predicted acyl esterase
MRWGGRAPNGRGPSSLRPSTKQIPYTQPYFAGHGYAAVRVDIRGSGELMAC